VTPDERIAAYQDAYFAANDKTIGVSFERGWYKVGWPSRKYRASQIDEMTATLRGRARERA
jgi:hypothetical protein